MNTTIQNHQENVDDINCQVDSDDEQQNKTSTYLHADENEGLERQTTGEQIELQPMSTPRMNESSRDLLNTFQTALVEMAENKNEKSQNNSDADNNFQ